MPVSAPASRAPQGDKNASLFRTASGRHYFVPFLLVTGLFFMWGFAHSLLDVLNKHFQNTLHLNKAQSAFVQSSMYFGYFVMALPAGVILRRLGYKGAVIFGLAAFAVGAFWFAPAVNINAYWAFLAGIFVIAMGLTCLETAANPYVTLLGPPETAASRINLAQTFNGLAWIVGPYVGGEVLFNPDKMAHVGNDGLKHIYVTLGIVVTVIAVAFLFAKLPEAAKEEEAAGDLPVAAANEGASLFSRKHFVGAIVAQFAYVAAQTGIFAFFINYTVDASKAWCEPGTHWSDGQAAKLFSGAFALFAGGRFLGSFVMRKLKAESVLRLYAGANVVLMAVVLADIRYVSLGAVCVSFFFMSIMFPTIFSLGVHNLGEKAKSASSFIIMAIVGGAIVTPAMGRIADIWSMRAGFVVPLVGFLVIFAYAFLWRRLAGESVRN